MVDSFLPGFSVTGDTDGRWPLVMASPHSGREYPPAFLAASRLSLAQLRRAEDPYVDELLDGVAGVPVLRARFGRAWLDLNRDADELDPAMFEGRLQDARPLAFRTTDRVSSGLGVLPRVAGQGLDIYRRRLTTAEAEARLRAVHAPWHSRIAELLARAHDRHGHAILVDCHSMPQPGGMLPAQIVLGDRYGTSASPMLMALIERHFTDAGWRVARNAPYAGGHTTAFHGNVAAGIHAVQIEIDRSLYVDAQRLQRNSGFDSVAAQLRALAGAIVEAAPGLDLGPAQREAAE